MNFYNKWILPHLIDIAMRNEDVARYRAALLPQARGAVLEIGAGSGLNLPFYPPDVKRLYALDPSIELLKMAQAKSDSVAFPVAFLAGESEAIPLKDRSVDTVVMTWTLCSVRDPGRALAEMRRVLRPQGFLLFAEHGCAGDARVRHWQERLTPAWRTIAGGCHLNRQVDRLIEAAGFAIATLHTGYANRLRPLSYMYCGQAMPRQDGG